MPNSAPFPIVTYTRDDHIISTDPDALDVATVHRYLSEESYWAKGIGLESVERSIQNSLCFGVYSTAMDSASLVGFARLVTDYATYAYLADVFILPEDQGHGLGKWLVETILNHPELQSVRRWTLYTKDAHGLYRQYGFEAEQDPEKYMCYRPGLPQADFADTGRRQ